ncbi:MAG: thiol reductant ABC exporter subunit CydC [Saezia sp.]
MKNRAPLGTWSSLKLVLGLFLKVQPFMIWLGIFMAALSVVCGITLLGLSGWFITATAIAGLQPLAFAFNVITPSATIRLLALSRTASRYGERLVTHSVTLRVIAELREHLFRGWATPQAARSLLKRPAQLLFRLTVDVDALDSLYLRIIVPACAALIVAVLVGLAFGLWINPWLGLALVLWLVLIGIGVPLLMSLRGKRFARLRAYAMEGLRARTVDLMAGQIEVLMAGRMGAQYDAVMKADACLFKADSEMNKLETMITFVHHLATTLTVVGFLLGCAFMVENAALGAPVAAFALLVLLAIFEPFTALQRGAVEFGRTLLAVKRLAPRLQVNAEDEQKMEQQPPEGVVLCLHNISYTYPETARKVVKDISLELKKGQRIALVGPSGSGKSTLLGLIAKELEADAGEILCTKFGMLTQRTELFQGTLRDNLLLANPEANDAELWNALENSGLAEAVHALPEGLNNWLGEGGQGLSGGQARRLALARLLLRRDAPLWLLDEPTEGLDAETANDVLKKILSSNHGQAILVATHLQREAEIADSILVFDESQVVGVFERGSPTYLSALCQLKPK